MDGTPPQSGRIRVLVVDDDPAIRTICATWLTLDGYEVLEAANGQEALELALAESPAAVVLDLSLPVLDGFGVAAALRADERTSGVPLVVLTSEAGPTVLDRLQEMGPAGYFTKPFDPGAVATFVRVVVGQLPPGSGLAPTGGHSI